jgi:hypothetical protein
MARLSEGTAVARGNALPIAARLEHDVRMLAEEIGERNLRDPIRHRALVKAAAFLWNELRETGRQPGRQAFWANERATENLELEIAGAEFAREVIVIGAHYDTVRSSPGGNDNGTGVAVVLQLARMFSQVAEHARPARTLRFVLFSCEEPPFTRTPQMGSMVYAARCKQHGEHVAGMLSLETLGSFYDGHRGPDAPLPFRLWSPFRGDFIAVIGNLASKPLTQRITHEFRASSRVRCRTLTAPGFLPGVRSSDHWSFWKHGYRASMITDTAPLRYRHYHRPTDRAANVDFERLAEITSGMSVVVQRLSNDPIS